MDESTKEQIWIMEYKLSPHEAFMYQTQTLSVGQELVKIPEQLQFPNLISSIQQEATESVIVAVVVAEETSNGQVDRHLVASLQVDGHNNSGTVLLVLHIFLTWSSHHLAVNLQTGAGGQCVTRRTSVTVDGEGEAVDTRARSSEDTSPCIVAITKVDEDMCVGDELVVAERAKAFQIVFISQSDREGTAAGWRSRGEEEKIRVNWEKPLIGLHPL